jgi:hypothetical protein
MTIRDAIIAATVTVAAFNLAAGPAAARHTPGKPGPALSAKEREAQHAWWAKRSHRQSTPSEPRASERRAEGAQPATEQTTANGCCTMPCSCKAPATQP